MSQVRYAASTDDLVDPGSPRTESVDAWALSLLACYETDPEIIASVLPRPLEPTDEPRVSLNISRVEMASGTRFGAANVTVRARHGDLVGEYALAMPIGSEAAVIGGRETFGEPKKLADISLERSGNEVRGTVTRHGITYLELRGRVVEKLTTPPPEETLDFYFKFLISPDGKGFDNDPALVHCRRTYPMRTLERVEGEIVLRDSEFDPVADLPVRRLLSFTLVDRRCQQRAEIVDRVPGEWIAPFVHQRYDAFSWKR